MKQKSIKNFFPKGSAVFVASEFDKVESGRFIGFSVVGNACIEIDDVVRLFESDAVFQTFRQALLYSRFIEDKTQYYFFPSGAHFAIKKRAKSLKIVDYTDKGHFVRELDILFEDFRISASSALMTEFELKHYQLNNFSNKIAMVHQTAHLNDAINNQPIQTAFFTSIPMQSDFTIFLN
jgi:hypothetical protein